MTPNCMCQTELVLSESIKTMSVENVSTGELNKNKEHFLRCKHASEKSYDVIRHKQLQMSKYKRFTIHDVKPTALLLFKVNFKKVGKYAGDTKCCKDNQQSLKLSCRIFYLSS